MRWVDEVDRVKEEADTDAYLKERFVICNEEDTDCRAIGSQQMRSGFVHVV